MNFGKTTIKTKPNIIVFFSDTMREMNYFFNLCIFMLFFIIIILLEWIPSNNNYFNPIQTLKKKYNFHHNSGPPLPAIPPGVFDKIGCWRIPFGARFGLFFGILGKRGLGRGRIGEVGSAG
jgi:hypothetical protein